MAITLQYIEPVSISFDVMFVAKGSGKFMTEEERKPKCKLKLNVLNKLSFFSLLVALRMLCERV